MYILDFFGAIVAVVTPIKLLILCGSVILGIIFGALPGLTATLAVALLSTVTFSLPSEVAILSLIGVYVGAVYGASHSAILIGIPGTSAGAATVLDGHKLAQQGRGGETLANATMGSMIGTILGLIAVLLVMPVMTLLALEFTSVEFFLLALFGVLICGSLTTEDLAAKGWIAGIIGLLISMVGMEALQGYPRFTFGSRDLAGGIDIVPVILGAFAIPQIIRAMRDYHPSTSGKMAPLNKLRPNWKFLWKCKALIARSGLIGVGVGAVPGVGEDVAAWASYDAARRNDKNPESFGTGNMRGVIAPEAAANACIGGAIIPVLTLAVPGSPPAAMLLGAMWMHNLRPGPMLVIDTPEVIPQISAYLFWSAIFMAICGLLVARMSVQVLRIPPTIFMPIVGIFAVIGSYALGLNMFSVYMMFFFGLIAYILEEMKYPVAPIVIGVILGQMADVGLRRGLLVSHGDLSPFYTRPLAIAFLILIVYSLISKTTWMKNAWQFLMGIIKPRARSTKA